MSHGEELDFFPDDGYFEHDDEEDLFFLIELDLGLHDFKCWDGQPSNNSIWYKPLKNFEVINQELLKEEKQHKA